ncbi:hypothetical protein CKALI_11575 [Corynebacterium kalinowskii]|uniref:Uncharacterized protein n=1 Tax=Corynebacterium kalinowskii TaxID=2675216 RepID=A0A6B8VU42_9CORY|nr:hypothetical protein [Corynebacterium kalinowskii]QGU03157.1 hypothetical protein CKALI_11575 [Corynebacterium kalinowskii]
MYGLFWRMLPGPTFVKALICLALLVGIFFLLMEVVFPYISTLMPYQEVAV